MRILQVVHQYPPDDIGGVELHTQALARSLARRGHTLSVFYRRSQEGTGVEQRREGDVTVWAAWNGIVQPTRRLLSTFKEDALLGAFRQVLDESAPDLVHIHHLMGLPVAIANLVHERGIAIVLTLHDYWWLCANAQLLTNDTEEVCEGPKLWINCGRCALARMGRDDALWLAPAFAPIFAARNWQLRHVAEMAERIIVPTQFTFNLFREMGLAPAKLTVVPHGIALPEGWVPPPRTDELAGTLRIAYVGGIAWQKGIHVLIEAVNLLPADGVTLTIYGNGDAFPEYTAQLQALASHPGIRFAGSIPNQQLLPALARADVLVVPSLWYETAALIIQEAFAAGIPVIASDIGALRERVRHGEDGLLVPPNNAAALRDALLKLLHDSSRLVRLRNGIRSVRSVEDQVMETEAIYQSAIKAHV